MKSLESHPYKREVTCPTIVEADLNSPGGTLQNDSFANNLYIVGIMINSEQLRVYSNSSVPCHVHACYW